MKKREIPPHYAHQLESIAFFSQRERGLDTSDPGTGKTRVHIEVFADRRRKGGKCLLVVCPKSLLHSAWEDDFAQYAPDMSVSAFNTSRAAKGFQVDADVYVVNTDAVKWIAKQKPPFFKKFDTLIVDEITAFKHRTSARSKALNRIKKHFKYRYGLTGTPTSNTLADIWHPMLIIDDGKRLGNSFFAFRAAIATPQQVGPSPNMVKWTDKPDAEKTVGVMISDITIRHVFEDCVDIPPNSINLVNFYMSPKHARVYNQVHKDAVYRFQSGEVVSAVNAAVLVNKLLQVSSGAVYPESREYQTIDTSRYELIADLIEQRDKCIVFFQWDHQRDELEKVFKKRGITYAVLSSKTTDTQREAAIQNFKKGFYRVFLAHPKSAAHGLTFVNANTTIWPSPTSDLEQFSQGNRRTYRIGQQRPTETIVVLAPGTIEDRTYERLTSKDAKQLGLLEMLQQEFNGE